MVCIVWYKSIIDCWLTRKHSFVGTVQVDDQEQHGGKCHGQYRHLGRAPGSRQTCLVAHRRHADECQTEKNEPDAEWNAAVETDEDPLRVQVNRLIQRLDEQARHYRRGVLGGNGHGA